MPRQPSLFLSHGSPMLALQDCPARDFLRDLSKVVEKPDAILIVSAHWEAFGPTVSTAPTLETIHDFYGFPDALYRLNYPAKGDPELAREAAALLGQAGMPVRIDDHRGLDHGAWVPLLLGFPGAEIPVAGVSLLPVGGPAAHLRIGAALAPLRDRNILVIGSGSFSHALGEQRGNAGIDDPAVDWVQEFREWVHAAVLSGDRARLADYRRQAPWAARNHPTEDHFLPIFVAMGAGTPATPGRVIHSSTTYGRLAMDCFAFD